MGICSSAAEPVLGSRQRAGTMSEVKSRANYSRRMSVQEVRKSKLPAAEQQASTIRVRSASNAGMIRGLKTSELDVKAVLGRGTLGTVELVQSRSSEDKVYARKAMWKFSVVQMGQQMNMQRERETLMNTKSPFLNKLIATYQDKNKIYFLLEPLLGGDLFHYLNAKTKLPEAQARYYGGCVVEAFDYLHSHGILYRGLKPEVVMLHPKGHAVLVDFGFSKKLAVNEKTSTVCGVPEYFAPEIIKGEEYSFPLDWWMLGVLIYEMVVGATPFAVEESNDPMAVAKNILTQNLKYPPGVSAEFMDLCKKLMNKNPAKRLGGGAQAAEDIRTHAWFTDFNFTALQELTLQPPETPELSGVLDTRYFDDFEPVDELKPYVPDGTAWDAEF